MVAAKWYGLSVDDIDWSSPADMEPYLKMHKEELKEKDYLAWLSNQYTLSAVLVVIEHCFAGRKARSEYIKEPFLAKAFENDGLTPKEIEEREIRKQIMIEGQWIDSSRCKGLPETIINKKVIIDGNKNP